MMRKQLLLLSLLIGTASVSLAQTGTAAEPVSYVGGDICNPRLHDGGLPYIIGVENIQVMRANRTHPDVADGFGWTYNHAPNITYWRGKFYLEYLSNPKDEHQPPGQTLLATSVDGRHWGKPVVAFPPYQAPAGVTFPKPYYGYIMHQRMGFYTAPSGRLLLVAFYGHSYSPFKEGGIGRVVREIRSDGSLGPIYFLRYSSHAQWSEKNTTYPFYRRSHDKGFVAACDALLADRLKTLQWIDEDRGKDGFYSLKDSVNTVQATSYYHRKDGKTVALWKWSWAALSSDNGLSWSTPVRVLSLIMAGGKNWGQRTADGRYAMAYNPIETQPYRYPLVLTSSDDGIVFDDMGVVHGEVPPRRFFGENKDFGPCYVRGITEGEQNPADSCAWLTYSVNKEDIWVSRIQLPARTRWQGPVGDDFAQTAPGAPVRNWNIYRPEWADVSVDKAHRLCMVDSDRYDYARAIRVFESTQCVAISFDYMVQAENDEPFEVDVTDRHGERAVSFSFHRGEIKMGNTVVGHYQPQTWEHFAVVVSARGTGQYVIGGVPHANLHAVQAVERLSLRTGLWRNLPDRNTPNQDKCPPLGGCDEPVKAAKYLIKGVKIASVPVC
uniref:Six-hairpin glycosidase n=1 Tax=Prevotella sp. GTC17260 TaxID=3236796 RepID=A0AB33JAW1_9BACT